MRSYFNGAPRRIFYAYHPRKARRRAFIQEEPSRVKHFCIKLIVYFPLFSFVLQDHHDDIRQEQKWEMQALSSTQGSSPDESIEHNGNGLSDACEPGTTNESSSSCGSQAENGQSSQHINNNTIAINNNNCDTIKNNNQTVTVAAAAPLEMVNDVEAVPAVALIEQQSALLRSVNIGMRVH